MSRPVHAPRSGEGSDPGTGEARILDAGDAPALDAGEARPLDAGGALEPLDALDPLDAAAPLGAASPGAAASPGVDHVRWDGSSPAVETIRNILVAHASAGVLRLVLQQLTLHEQGRASGMHESMDAIVDVGGNLVTMTIRESVRADPAVSARLDAALAELREAITADLGTAVDSLEVVTDADGTRQVLIVLAVEVSPQDVESGTPHAALHGGAHHITHHAPVLDELRDRLAAPAPGPLRRLWTRLTAHRATPA